MIVPSSWQKHGQWHEPPFLATHAAYCDIYSRTSEMRMRNLFESEFGRLVFLRMSSLCDLTISDCIKSAPDCENDKKYVAPCIFSFWNDLVILISSVRITLPGELLKKSTFKENPFHSRFQSNFYDLINTLSWDGLGWYIFNRQKRAGWKIIHFIIFKTCFCLFILLLLLLNHNCCCLIKQS